MTTLARRHAVAKKVVSVPQAAVFTNHAAIAALDAGIGHQMHAAGQDDVISDADHTLFSGFQSYNFV